MDISHELHKILVKIIIGLAEVSVIIFTSVLSIFASVLVYFLRSRIFKILAALGITYFQERHKNIREINSDLLWCQGALRADSYSLYRTFNGQAYINEEVTFNLSDTDSKPNVFKNKKITVRKINSKPSDFFPEFLDYEIYKSIIHASMANDWSLISYDAVKRDYPTSPLIIFLEANGIDNLMSYKIWDMNTKTFGIILFTWSKKPSLENLFDRTVSKKLDSISIRFQNYIVSSIVEKAFNFRIIR
ncbi:MAG TPA: hypothetical protein PLG41_23510 [Leptospiraceae bacterium]|nr:hypothetical protein [Leptospiraceae bacterium]